jgi:hypothetical protein
MQPESVELSYEAPTLVEVGSVRDVTLRVNPPGRPPSPPGRPSNPGKSNPPGLS